MTRVANQFRDPATGDTYDWPINHSDENETARSRNIEHTAPTSGRGLVRQQGDDSPLVFTFSGTILHAAQNARFVEWYELGRDQTVIFRDWTGAEYEVLITAYQPRRERVMWNPRDPDMRDHIIRWSMTLEVVQVLAGPWEGSAP